MAYSEENSTSTRGENDIWKVWRDTEKSDNNPWLFGNRARISLSLSFHPLPLLLCVRLDVHRGINLRVRANSILSVGKPRWSTIPRCTTFLNQELFASASTYTYNTYMHMPWCREFNLRMGEHPFQRPLLIRSTTPGKFGLTRRYHTATFFSRRFVFLSITNMNLYEKATACGAINTAQT